MRPISTAARRAKCSCRYDRVLHAWTAYYVAVARAIGDLTARGNSGRTVAVDARNARPTGFSPLSQAAQSTTHACANI